MRVCPTNVIQPADLVTGGIQGFWTPVLNFRIGSSGCQLHCIACGHLCPTGAILPLTLDRRAGINAHAADGPIRMGTAFVDQGRCLPWAMNRPCIVCQENCPVSPKAIGISEAFSELTRVLVLGPETPKPPAAADQGQTWRIDRKDLVPGEFGTGDYRARDVGTGVRRRILWNTENSLTLSPEGESKGLDTGSTLAVEVRLQRPVVNPQRCIGCGVCEHECPVRGRRAIRVTAENETRNRGHALINQRK
jgi:ferredoxin